MAEDHKNKLAHLLVSETASTHRYTRPGSGGGSLFTTPIVIVSNMPAR
jgi:hypothetical protein